MYDSFRVHSDSARSSFSAPSDAQKLRACSAAEKTWVASSALYLQLHVPLQTFQIAAQIRRRLVAQVAIFSSNFPISFLQFGKPYGRKFELGILTFQKSILDILVQQAIIQLLYIWLLQMYLKIISRR